MSIVLIEATSNSLSISWPEVTGASHYVLKYKRGSCSDKAEFETLSNALTLPQARKRNLEDVGGTGFLFRAGPLLNGEREPSSWVTNEEPFFLLSEDEEKSRMKAPSVSLAGSNRALLISWEEVKNAKAYELQMREDAGGSPWKTISSGLTGTEARKKNLTSNNGYQFRVRPVTDSSSSVFSPSSNPVLSLGLSTGLRNLFKNANQGTLLKKAGETISIDDGLGGKEFVLLYASAYWCGPCRQFTPMLSKWYHGLGPNKLAEVVFLSADHDENGFKQYYNSMPWLAVDYDDAAREELMAFLKVSGIPRLAVLDARTGRLIEDNAVGKTLDLRRWRTMANGS